MYCRATSAQTNYVARRTAQTNTDYLALFYVAEISLRFSATHEVELLNVCIKIGWTVTKSVDVCIDYYQRFPCNGRKTWYGDSAFVTIYFSPDGKVTEYGYAGGMYIDRAYLVTDSDPYPDGK